MCSSSHASAASTDVISAVIVVATWRSAYLFCRAHFASPSSFFFLSFYNEQVEMATSRGAMTLRASHVFALTKKDGGSDKQTRKKLQVRKRAVGDVTLWRPNSKVSLSLL